MCGKCGFSNSSFMKVLDEWNNMAVWYCLCFSAHWYLAIICFPNQREIEYHVKEEPEGTKVEVKTEVKEEPEASTNGDPTPAPEPMDTNEAPPAETPEVKTEPSTETGTEKAPEASTSPATEVPPSTTMASVVESPVSSAGTSSDVAAPAVPSVAPTESVAAPDAPASTTPTSESGDTAPAQPVESAQPDAPPAEGNQVNHSVLLMCDICLALFLGAFPFVEFESFSALYWFVFYSFLSTILHLTT